MFPSIVKYLLYMITPIISYNLYYRYYDKISLHFDTIFDYLNNSQMIFIVQVAIILASIILYRFEIKALLIVITNTMTNYIGFKNDNITEDNPPNVDNNVDNNENVEPGKSTTKSANTGTSINDMIKNINNISGNDPNIASFLNTFNKLVPENIKQSHGLNNVISSIMNSNDLSMSFLESISKTGEGSGPGQGSSSGLRNYKHSVIIEDETEEMEEVVHSDDSDDDFIKNEMNE